LHISNKVRYFEKRHSIRNQWETFVSDIKHFVPYNKTVNGGRGQGIVFTTRTDRLEILLFQIDVLRSLDINNPVQVFIEDPTANQKLLKQFQKRNAEVIYMDVGEKYYSTIKDGKYTWKMIALVYSTFDQIFFIDEDNVALRNLQYLFDYMNVQNASALFFPDLWNTNEKNKYWPDFNGVPTHPQNFANLTMVKTNQNIYLFTPQRYANRNSALFCTSFYLFYKT